MAVLKKRVTGFNVFCQDQHNENSAGFAMGAWSEAWRKLSPAEKGVYVKTAESQQSISLETAMERLQQLIKYIKGLEVPGLSLALLGTKDGIFHVSGFGIAYERVKCPKLAADIVGNVGKEDGENGRSKIEILRATAIKKMSSIAERDLKKRHFPYSKTAVGENTYYLEPMDIRMFEVQITKPEKLRWTPSMKTALEEVLGDLSVMRKVPGKGALDALLDKQQGVLLNVRRVDV